MTFALYAYALGRVSAVDAKNFSCGCSIKADRKKKSRPFVRSFVRSTLFTFRRL